MLHSRAIMRAQGFHLIPEEDGKSAQWMVLQPHEEMQEGKAGDKDRMRSHCVRHWSWSVMNRTITQSCSEATPPCYHLEVSPLSPRSHTWELDSRPQILPVRAPPKLRDVLWRTERLGETSVHDVSLRRKEGRKFGWKPCRLRNVLQGLRVLKTVGYQASSNSLLGTGVPLFLLPQGTCDLWAQCLRPWSAKHPSSLEACEAESHCIPYEGDSHGSHDM